MSNKTLERGKPIHSLERCETHEGKDVVTGRQMELQKILDPDSAWFGRWLCWICIGRVYPQFLFSPRTRRGARRAPPRPEGGFFEAHGFRGMTIFLLTFTADRLIFFLVRK